MLFLPLYEAIRGNASKLYAGMKLSGTTLFRLTRDAEVEVDDEADEADAVREQIRQRRYEPVVRLELAPGADPSIREMLRRRFELLPLDVYDLPDELDYTSLFQIAGLPMPGLRYPAWEPADSGRYRKQSRRLHRHTYRRCSGSPSL
jgi:polyphosphate kinase